MPERFERPTLKFVDRYFSDGPESQLASAIIARRGFLASQSYGAVVVCVVKGYRQPSVPVQIRERRQRWLPLLPKAEASNRAPR